MKSQAQTVSEQLTHQAAETPSPTGTKVIIPSALELTPEQEQRLLNHARNRLSDLKADLGRDELANSDGSTAPILDSNKSAISFFGRRHLAHLVAQQRMDWRAELLGGLYKESNLHLPITARIITQQSARAQKTFFGTSPWLAVSGLSADSDILAEDVNAYARHQLDTLGGMASGLEAAVDLAFIQGESVVKTRRNKLFSYFESWRDLAIDPQTGQPFVAEDGDYIYKTDQFIEVQEPVIDELSGQPMADPQTGEVQMQGTGQMVLKRDGSTPQPLPDMAAEGVFQTVKIDLKKELANRIEARPIYFLDFLAPLSGADVQTADACFHLYNAQVIELAHRYLTDENFQTRDPEAQIHRIRRLVNDLLPGTNDDDQAAGDKSRPELGESLDTYGKDRQEPTVGLAESWLWFDPFGDGVQRSIMVLMDENGRVPIYYDYTANLTPDGLRPFDVVRINPPPGRWHGTGNVERFWNLQVYADLLLNRALFAESRAARVDIWNPHLTKEGQKNPNLQLNWGGTYTLADMATDPAKVLTPIYLSNIKNENLSSMVQLILQMAQNMSGITNVNDGAMAGMDTAKLATGIRNLEASGEELFHQYIAQLRPALEAICKRALKQLLATLPEAGESRKVTQFFDRQSQRMLEIDPHRLQDLDLDIRLELTTYKGEMKMQQAQAGYNMVSNYLMQPTHAQARLRPFVKQFLQATEMHDTDTILAPLSPEEMAGLMAPPAGDPGAPPADTASLPI